MQNSEGLRTFRHNFRNKGRILGLKIENGYIYPKDKEQENMLFRSSSFKSRTIILCTEEELSTKTPRYKKTDGVIVEAPKIFDLFTTAEKHELKKLTPKSKEKIYDLAAELVKMELGTDWLKEKIRDVKPGDKTTKSKEKKKVKLIEIPQMPSVKVLREICKSQKPPIAFEKQDGKETLTKLIEERNKAIALKSGETTKEKEETPEQDAVKKNFKVYNPDEIEKLSGAELDKIFNENGLSNEGLSGDEEKREVLNSFFENVAKEDE